MSSNHLKIFNADFDGDCEFEDFDRLNTLFSIANASISTEFTDKRTRRYNLLVRVHDLLVRNSFFDAVELLCRKGVNPK